MRKIGIEPKVGDIVWACAFDADFDRRDGCVVRLRCKPVRGVIEGRGYGNYDTTPTYFTKLNKNNQPVRSNNVRYSSRYYFNTEEECMTAYNFLIREKQKKLRDLADSLEDEII